MKSNFNNLHCKGFVTIGLVLQIIFIIIYGVLFKYDGKKESNEHSRDQNQIYPLLQDVQAMIFIGFGFLMTFLKRYGFSSVGINFFLSGILIQFALIVNGISHMIEEKQTTITIKVSSIADAEFATAAVLISFGAVLGKCSLAQYMLMGLIELIIFRLNEILGRDVLKAVDAGDSMYVHAFGAYFGLGVSAILCRDQRLKNNPKEGSTYNSDMFAMIGTLILWIYWPSFNSAGYDGEERTRAAINTIISLLCSLVATFIVCMLIPMEEQEHDQKPEDEELLSTEGQEKTKKIQVYGTLDMVCVQNSTLAGGVAIGTAASMMVGIHSAAIVGFVAGTISVLGYKFVTPRLNKLTHDTCGVHNLHGLPAVLAGIVGMIFAFTASAETYGESFEAVFDRTPDKVENSWLGGMQALATLTSVSVGLLGGALTGLLLKLLKPFHIPPAMAYDDDLNWEVPEDAIDPSKSAQFLTNDTVLEATPDV